MGAEQYKGGCGRRCEGFLTDREQRKVWGVGVLYVLGFPILILILVVGAIKASSPGSPNPSCPAEPSLPWMLILGGSGVSMLLLTRVAIVKCTRYIKNTQRCCDEATGCRCEFGCNLLYDIILMVAIVMWMIPVTWWVFRHWLGPDTLYSILGEENLTKFRDSLGDKDDIHVVQFDNPGSEDYCDRILYMVAFIALTAGWVILFSALIVFIVDKILSQLVCCLLCGERPRDDHRDHSSLDTEGEVQLRPHAAIRTQL